MECVHTLNEEPPVPDAEREGGNREVGQRPHNRASLGQRFTGAASTGRPAAPAVSELDRLNPQFEVDARRPG
jgi:hypothetical protein